MSRKVLVAVFWSLLSAAAIAVVILRFSTTVDLGYFLPAPVTVQESVLVRRLGQGNGSQLWFISLPAGFSDDPAVGSAQFKTYLEDTGLFSFVRNGQESLSPELLPQPIWQYRYWLTDNDFGSEGLQEVVSERAFDLLMLPDSDAEALLLADPYLASVTAMENAGIAQSENMQWIRDGAAILVAESLAPAFDVQAQAEVDATIRAGTQQLFGSRADTFGAGAYGVRLQNDVRAEAQWRSILASLMVVVVLLSLYRRWSVVLAGMLPLMIGGIVALAVVSLTFGQVHGITLAFGFTMLGVALDYPLHVFSHLRSGHEQIRVIRPVLLLGVLSTAVAYIALMVSGSQGLAQLGLFSATGIVVALLVSLSWLPLLVSDVPQQAAASTGSISLTHRVWIPVLLAGVALLAFRSGGLWSDDLSKLTPVPEADLQRDAELREQFGAPDMRYLILLHSDTEQELLARTAALVESLRESGVISGVSAVSDLLPNEQTQARRLLAQQQFEVTQLRSIEAEQGLVAGVFEPFAKDLQASIHLAPISKDTWLDSVFAAQLQAQLYEQDGIWYSLVIPRGIDDAAIVAGELNDIDEQAVLIDLKMASASLVARYRQVAINSLLVAVIIIAGILLIYTGLSRRWFWLAGSIAAAVLAAVAASSLILGSLSLFNLVAVVLVAGLGLDYALFLSHGCRASGETVAHSRHAVKASALSTGLAFGVLSLSGIPVLAGIGTTVVCGVTAAYVISRLGVRSAA